MDWWQFGIGLAIIVGSVWAIFRTYYEKQESLLKEQNEILKSQIPKASELESRVNIIEKAYEKEMKTLKKEFKREMEEMISVIKIYKDGSDKYYEQLMAELTKQVQLFGQVIEKSKNLSPEEREKLEADSFRKLMKKD